MLFFATTVSKIEKIEILVILWYIYLTGRGFSVSEHMGKSRDDVNGETDQKSPDCRIDRSEKGEDDSQEPNGYNHGKSCQCP